MSTENTDLDKPIADDPPVEPPVDAIADPPVDPPADAPADPLAETIPESTAVKETASQENVLEKTEEAASAIPSGGESITADGPVLLGEKEETGTPKTVEDAPAQTDKEQTDIEDPELAVSGTDSEEEFLDEAERASRSSKRAASREAVQAAQAKLMASPVTAKFMLTADGRQQTLTFACTLGQSIGGLRNYFAEEMRLLPDMILIYHNGLLLEDDSSLHQLGAQPNGTIELELKSSDPDVIPLRLFRPAEEQNMRDVITVKVQLADGTYKDMIVEIERTHIHKPFLGGYKHKLTGVEYHHASMQTIRKTRPPPRFIQFNRDAQTVEMKNLVQQTTQDMATQMTGVGVFVSTEKDKLMVPRKYLTAARREEIIVAKVILIQKQWRRWLARRKVASIRREMKQKVEYERLEEEKKVREREERLRREYERRMNPRTKEDFDLLYQYLEKWKQEETAVIDSEMTGAERKAALCRLLDRETELLSTVDRHKLAAAKETRNRTILNFLDKAAASKRWRGHDGKPTEMDTPYTIRARELRNIYATLNMRYLTQDERLDVLLTTKHTVKEFDCKLTREIMSLIDREADLLLRGVPENTLDGLRQRVSTLFLQFIKTPTFNPEIARYLKVPQDPSILKHNVHFCSSCCRYLPSNEFDLTSHSRKVGRCRQCIRLDNIARARQDFVYYRNMLAELQRSEELYGDDSQVAFALQEADIRYLVDNVWGGHSALSGWDDMTELTMARWDKNNHWTPWNSILLTRDEACAHLKVEYPNEVYGKTLRQTIAAKHTEARHHFARLASLDAKLSRKSTAGATNTSGGTSGGKAGGRRALSSNSMKSSSSNDDDGGKLPQLVPKPNSAVMMTSM